MNAASEIPHSGAYSVDRLRSTAPGDPPRPAMVRPDGIDRVPKSLAELEQWVGWKYEIRGGKPTKVPVQPGGRPAKANDPLTWTAFETVFAAAKQNPRLGIGFVFAENGGIVGVDLDNCLDAGGNLKTWAVPILERFADTYSEVSPSSTGIKIFCRGDLDGAVSGTGTRRSYGDGQVEVYRHGRFFTLTGRAFNGAPRQLEEHSANVGWLLRLIKALTPITAGGVPKTKTPSARAKSTQQADPSPEDIGKLRDVLAAAQENDTKFRALFRGDLCGFPSKSEGDLALCGMLAALGMDAHQIDAAFRISGRMRTKWDDSHFAGGRTYGSATVHKALERTPHQSPRVAVLQGVPVADPRETLKNMGVFAGLKIKHFRKLGLQQAQFQMVVAGEDSDTVVTLGGAADVLTARTCRARIADATTVVIPGCSRERWDQVAALIFLAAGPGEDAGIEEHDETRAWLGSFLKSRTIFDFDSGSLVETIKDRSQGVLRDTDGRLCLDLQDLRQHIAVNFGDKLTSKQAGLRLRQINFEGGDAGRLVARDGDKIISRRCWKSPPGWSWE